MRWRPLLGAAALTLLASPGAAQDVSAGVTEARGQALVGERFDGYLGLVVEAPPALRAHVANVNIRRRALYADLARRRGVSLEEVGIAAACQLLGTVGVGDRYMLGDHVWRVRVAGQEMLTPDYCR